MLERRVGVFEPHIFNSPRLIVKVDCPAIGFVDPGYKKGSTFTHYTKEEMDRAISLFPDVIRVAEWYEDRTIDELLSVKHIEVVEYLGYFLVGDVLRVTGYEFRDTNTLEPKLIGYRTGDSIYKFKMVKPVVFKPGAVKA